MINFLKSKYFVSLLFLIGIGLRVFDFWDWSLTNDELSAINRTQYDSLIELIKEGIYVDGHPAFTQIFLFYWIKLTGNIDWLIRLPFVISGCLSLVYLYKLAKSLFNTNVAIIGLSIFSVLQPFIIYSQIARPYSFGILFTLAFSFYAFELTNKKSTATILGYVVFACLGILSHYFAALSILLTGICFLVFCNKTTIKTYLLYSCVVLLLCSLHLPITLNHFSLGGLSWLSSPDSSFINKYLTYSVNYSLIFGILILFLPLIAFFSKFQISFKKQFILILLFTLPLAFGYYYSVHYSPILQYSVLLFSLPCLIIFLSSFFSSKLKLIPTMAISLVILTLGSFSLIAKAKIYEFKPFSNFKGVAEKSIELTKKYNDLKFLSFSNNNGSSYLGYYFNQFKASNKFDISQFDSAKHISMARDLIEEKEADVVLVAYANTPVPFEVHEFIKKKFPSVVEHHRFFNSEVILYGKQAKVRRKIFYANPDTNELNWSISPSTVQDSNYFSSPIAYFINSETEYALTYRDTVKNLFSKKNTFLTIGAMLKSKRPLSSKIVISIDRDGNNIHWRGIELEHFYRSEAWYEVLGVFSLPNSASNTDLMTIYFWNNDKDTFYVDDFELTNYVDSDYNYYETPY